jgi:hypothetical protein
MLPTGRALLAGVVVLFFAGAVPVRAQPADGPSPRRARLALSDADWAGPKAAASAVRVEDGVRLRAGAAEGRVTSAPIALPFPVNGVAPQWTATGPGGTAVAVALRVSPDGTTWSRWLPTGHRAPPERAPTGAAGDRTTSGGMVLTESTTRYVQVRLTLRRDGAASPRLRRLSLYLVDATAGPSAPDARTQAPPTAAPDTAAPALSARDEWGAQSPTAGYRYARATHLALHHTATASAGAADTWAECAAGVRAIQDYHIHGRGWIDIGYNYLVCQTGAIFRGREDRTPRRDVVGAHDGYNEGSVGTAALGYFHPPENQRPTSDLLASVVDLFAWVAARRDIDPTGVAAYAGYGRTLRTVYGHRDVKATACPGDHLYPRRSDVVDRVDALVPTPPATTTLAENAPNPASTVTRFALRLSARTPVTLTVYDLLGRHVRTRRYGPLPAGEHTVSVRTARWASGTYPYRLRAGDATQTGTIRVVR